MQYSSGANNYNLIGNPYASAINLKSLTTGSGAINASISTWVGGTFYIYNPLKNVSTSTAMVGGYDTYSNDGATNVVIPSMGAFFLQALAAGQTVNFSESAKTATASLAVMGGATVPQLQLQVANDKGSWDDLKLRFEDAATDKSTDRFDAEKWSNQLFDFYSLSSEGKRLAIDARSMNTVVIPLGIKTSVTDNSFRIKVQSIAGLEGQDILLRDKLLKTETKLQTAGDSVSFAITTDTATKGDNRFELVFNKKSTVVAIDNTGAAIGVYPNPIADHITVNTGIVGSTSTIQLFNTDGKLIKEVQTNQSVTVIPIKDASSGFYVVKVTDSAGKVSVKKIVKQ